VLVRHPSCQSETWRDGARTGSNLSSWGDVSWAYRKNRPISHTGMPLPAANMHALARIASGTHMGAPLVLQKHLFSLSLSLIIWVEYLFLKKATCMVQKASSYIVSPRRIRILWMSERSTCRGKSALNHLDLYTNNSYSFFLLEQKIYRRYCMTQQL
jgi:hypothetical protein